MPETLSATFRIATPMFIGGADQSPSDGIRSPSVKGALRFWWRALNWSEFRNQSGADDASALQDLHKEEARLFGIAANEDVGRGQGCFLLRVSHKPLLSINEKTTHPNFERNDAARYLGYGLMVAFGRKDGPTPSGQLLRGCLNEKQEFTVTLVFREGVEKSVRDALIAWGLLGGLGSRSRHGMGSVALMSLEEKDGKEKWTTATDVANYDQKIKALFSDMTLPATEPPFSAFWQGSRIDRLLSGADCYAVLDAFGKAMLKFRSWGRSNPGGGSAVLGSPSEQRFKNDHDWYRVPGWAAANPAFHPERVEFGLPHNYHKDHHHVVAERHERRSSPLFFHVHPVGNQYVGVGVYLPAQFLPYGEKINANGTPVPAAIIWTLITGFIDGKVGNPPTAADRFPGKVKVLP